MKLADPNQWTLITWIFVVVFSMSGGIVTYYARMKLGPKKVFNLLELLGELFTGVFVGVTAFLWSAYWGNPLTICLLAAGAGGHLAAKLLFIFDKMILKKLGYDERLK